MPDDLRRYRVPITPTPIPEYLQGRESPQISPTGAEREGVEPSRERGDGRWESLVSTHHPDAAKHDDGISDLFEVGQEDDTSDLVSVDIDKDIIDTNERGGLDDLTEVSEEDIMGDEETGQIPLEYTPDDDEMIQEFNGARQNRKYRIVPRQATRAYREPPDISMRGMR